MLKIGLIGVGKLGKSHAILLKSIPSFDFVGCFDSDQERLHEVCAELNIQPFSSALELIKMSDAIDIVTPAASHYEYAVAAIKNARHVFIEKPIANTVEEAAHLASLAHEANIKIQVGHIERYNPAYRAVENIDLNPMFIEAHRLSTFDARGTDVSVVLDLMVHDLDIILSLIKSNIKNINANGVSVITDHIDIANARIEFENGCVANVTASRISMKKMRKIRLFQKDAYISMDFLEKKSEIIRITEDEVESGLTLKIGDQSKNLHFIQPKINETNALEEELKDFCKNIENHTEPKVTATDGLKAMELAEQILKRIRKNNSF